MVAPGDPGGAGGEGGVKDVGVGVAGRDEEPPHRQEAEGDGRAGRPSGTDHHPTLTKKEPKRPHEIRKAGKSDSKRGKI